VLKLFLANYVIRISAFIFHFSEREFYYYYYHHLHQRLRWSRGSVLAFGTQVRGFKPGRTSRIFLAKKILSTPSFGGEVKPSVPCRALQHVKEPKSDVEVATFSKISLPFLAHSSTFRCWVR
jgi:hypothetical protein